MQQYQGADGKLYYSLSVFKFRQLLEQPGGISPAAGTILAEYYTKKDHATIDTQKFIGDFAQFYE